MAGVAELSEQQRLREPRQQPRSSPFLLWGFKPPKVVVGCIATREWRSELSSERLQALHCPVPRRGRPRCEFSSKSFPPPDGAPRPVAASAPHRPTALPSCPCLCAGHPTTRSADDPSTALPCSLPQLGCHVQKSPQGPDPRERASLRPQPSWGHGLFCPHTAHSGAGTSIAATSRPSSGRSVSSTRVLWPQRPVWCMTYSA